MSREEAYACALALAAQHDLTLEQLASRLLYTLCAGVPSEELANKLTAMFHAITGVEETE